MGKRTCSIDGCDNPHRARGWCKKHWMRWHEYGSPYGPPVVPIVDLPGERWLPVVGWEGLYKVSDQGRVRSLDRIVPFGNRTRLAHGQLLAQCVGTHGYLTVGLSNGEERSTPPVHQLVARAFLGPMPAGQEVRHGREGKHCNLLANLSYGTPVQNAADKVRDGTDNPGSRHPSAKLTEEIVRECRERHAGGGVSYYALAKEFGVHPVTMRVAVMGRTWKHVA